MNHTEEAIRIIDALAAAPAHTVAVVLAILGGTAKLSPLSTAYSRLVDGTLPSGPFSALDFRQPAGSETDVRSFLVLDVRVGANVSISALASHYGPALVQGGRASTARGEAGTRWRLASAVPPVLFIVHDGTRSLDRVIFDRAPPLSTQPLKVSPR